MKKPLFYSFALLLALSLFACNNNETRTKDISQVKENPSVAKLEITLRLDLGLTIIPLYATQNETVLKEGDPFYD